ncbi:unnamed protein product [Paramecium octaurelia]|uniref:Uncharacterized protein n=1 Tax=Paramecium octaurelia TaxID=43137 RepID=A0A8S1WEV6_PAROT|nr:unnamed protein product [Paramecium octaurelia]
MIRFKQLRYHSQKENQMTNMLTNYCTSRELQIKSLTEKSYYDSNSYFNRQQENKYQENKQLDDRVIDKSSHIKNLQKQYSQQPESIKQQLPKAIDNHIDYLVLGLTREEIEQQKAYFESLSQQNKPLEAQPTALEYKF